MNVAALSPTGADFNQLVLNNIKEVPSSVMHPSIQNWLVKMPHFMKEQKDLELARVFGSENYSVMELFARTK
jgi:hypothetical protein